MSFMNKDWVSRQACIIKFHIYSDIFDAEMEERIIGVCKATEVEKIIKELSDNLKLYLLGEDVSNEFGYDVIQEILPINGGEGRFTWDYAEYLKI